MKTNLKVAANNAWKEENFSLFGVVRYINKNGKKEPNLKAYLAEKKISADEVTIDLIKSGVSPEKFFCYDKTGEATGPKTKFSLWFALTALSEVSKARK